MAAKTPSIQIRPAIPADVKTILRFVAALAEYEHLSHQVIATEENYLAYLFGPDQTAEVLIAELNGKPTGFAMFFPTFSTFLGKPGIWLEDVFVLPEFRGQGVGKTLLKAVAKLAADRNCGRLEWAVLDWNQPAIDFYKRFGAVPLEDWRICRVTGEALQNFGQRNLLSPAGE